MWATVDSGEEYIDYVPSEEDKEQINQVDLSGLVSLAPVAEFDSVSLEMDQTSFEQGTTVSIQP